VQACGRVSGVGRLRPSEVFFKSIANPPLTISGPAGHPEERGCVVLPLLAAGAAADARHRGELAHSNTSACLVLSTDHDLKRLRKL
jgi:hypothetical protein